ncbi:MAG: formimidoylglutamase [Leeuwenhoekiella sp.]|uniref:formimidoylglutamase n=1 Tax=Leeuwenhoekiella TaxID=283735 RepID=UPI002353DF81|nr:formimidoylglutamase [Leeuwenhoekiella blandensis]|tara:strand:- start:241 stop:1407 length:1167 start_codon:yes stop_codon:yes gene_type:complete
MAFENLTPISDAVVAHAALFNEQSLFNQIKLHTRQNGMPELQELQIAIIGVRENRGASEQEDALIDFAPIRKALYRLFPGNWHTLIGDLGDLEPGASLSDTFYALQDIVGQLVKHNVIPLIIGGSQDLTYALYRAFDNLDQMVNLVNVDSCFDLGDSSLPMTHKSFVGKIIVDQPYNLFNYSNVGFQTYYNSQEEIDLMEKLYFDAFRLGNTVSNLSSVEPVMRDADVVSFDLSSIQSEGLGYMHPEHVNGFTGREACAIARYAGLSDRVSVFGIFEYLLSGKTETASALVAQLIWYFIEGVNYRIEESLADRGTAFLHYNVPVEDEVLSFYKSTKSERWWIEIPFLEGVNNKLKRHTLLPCTQEDYENACNQEIPERWYKAKRKNEV